MENSGVLRIILRNTGHGVKHVVARNPCKSGLQDATITGRPSNEEGNDRGAPHAKMCGSMMLGSPEKYYSNVRTNESSPARIREERCTSNLSSIKTHSYS